MSKRVALALALLLATGAAAEVRQIEAVGAIPMRSDARRSTPPRDAAVRDALDRAVRQVALDLLPGMSAEEADEFLPKVLGGDPFAYTARFRITEDRGEVPASLTQDPGAALEYVVVVEAHVDADRVEKQLQQAGMLSAHRAGEPARSLRVVVEDLPSYAAYEALLGALVAGAGAESAVPVEFARGRAEIAVESRFGPSDLFAHLHRTAPPELQITSLGVEGDVLRLRIAFEPPPETPDPAGTRPPPD